MQEYVMAFLVGGLICVVGQLLMDLTNLTPAHVLVVFVVVGTILGGLGWYQPLVELGGAGATIPLTGFGNSLAVGTLEGVDKYGFLGVFNGALSANASGMMAAIVFGFFMAVLFNPKG
ncbi:MAG: stage sporulation protein [Firmicutes bacterium]|nr:stage sporulation protein [Bacillota bacterium]